MSEPLYRIKPLEWRGTYNGVADQLVTEAVWGLLKITIRSDGTFSLMCPASRLQVYDSLEAAKAAANEHNRQMMERGLEAVETTEGE